MKKISMSLIVTLAVIAAGTAFVAYSFRGQQGDRGFLGRITGPITDTAAALVDVPEDVVTGRPVSGDASNRGALGTVVGGAGDVVAGGLSGPRSRYEDDYIETEVDADEDEIFSEEDVEEEEE